jgi:outer membrane protein OmpA-like peptidoglycan-associated protein
MTRIIVCILAWLCTTTAWAGTPQRTLLLTPVDKRITDEAIAADMNVFKAAQARIAALNADGIPLRNYYLAKAQAWLELAEEEYTENDRGAIIEVALQQALYLIEELEARAADISMETPSLDSQTRPDLWRKVEAWKAQGPGCVDSATAELEVQLVRVDHEQHELGFLHAKPYLLKAERLVEQIPEQSDPSCRASLTQAAPPPPAEQREQPAVVEPMEPTPASVIPSIDAFPPSGVAEISVPGLTGESKIDDASASNTLPSEPSGAVNSIQTLTPVIDESRVPTVELSGEPREPMAPPQMPMPEVPGIAVPSVSEELPADSDDSTLLPGEDSVPISTPAVETEVDAPPVSSTTEPVEPIPAALGSLEAISPQPPSLHSEADTMETPSASLQMSQHSPMAAGSNSSLHLESDGNAPLQDSEAVAAMNMAVTLLQARQEQTGSSPEVIAGSIHFGTNRSRINPIAARLLDHVAAVLRANPDIQVQLDGHADRRGPHSYNIRLGHARAQAAERYLLQAGISAERLTLRSFGKRNPLVSGHTPKQLAQNRRVDILITESPAITSQPQEDDLQLDIERRHRAHARVATR